MNSLTPLYHFWTSVCHKRHSEMLMCCFNSVGINLALVFQHFNVHGIHVCFAIICYFISFVSESRKEGLSQRELTLKLAKSPLSLPWSVSYLSLVSFLNIIYVTPSLIYRELLTWFETTCKPDIAKTISFWQTWYIGIKGNHSVQYCCMNK